MTLLVFVLVEGVSSLILFANDLLEPTQGRNSAVYQMHDEELGWVNIPNLRMDEIYGPGTYLQTNSLSLRSDSNSPRAIPDGKKRILCSGDSFTLGIGVSNLETWCAALASLDPSLETANLGEAGYGIDQMYLKYQRLADSLDHNLHIVAFITDDFRRLGLETFVGWDKPAFQLEDGELVLINTPVARRAFYVPWLSSHRHFFDDLRVIQLGDRALRKLGLANSSPGAVDTEQKRREIALALFDRLEELGRSKGATTVLVYLKQRIQPVQGEEERIAWLREEMRARGIILIDLASEFDSLPAEALTRAFLPPPWGHYSPEGHSMVARMLLEKMRVHPELEALWTD
jgi:hypothetical protein